MKFPKLCAVPTLLYYLVCLLSTPLFSQIATPTFETSHGPGPSITICEETPVTFLVSNVPANSFFSFFRVPDGGSPEQLSVLDPTLAQITVEEHALNDTFFAEIVYSQSGVTSTTQTTSITVDYFPSPTNLVLSTNLGAKMGFRIQNFDIGGQFTFPLRKINQALGPKIFQFYTRFDLTDYRYGGDTNKRLNQNNHQ